VIDAFVNYEAATTGIPPTEAEAVRTKGDLYRAYQARVSKFVPLPPKRSQTALDGSRGC